MIALLLAVALYGGIHEDGRHWHPPEQSARVSGWPYLNAQDAKWVAR